MAIIPYIHVPPGPWFPPPPPKPTINLYVILHELWLPLALWCELHAIAHGWTNTGVRIREHSTGWPYPTDGYEVHGILDGEEVCVGCTVNPHVMNRRQAEEVREEFATVERHLLGLIRDETARWNAGDRSDGPPAEWRP